MRWIRCFCWSVLPAALAACFLVHTVSGHSRNGVRRVVTGLVKVMLIATSGINVLLSSLFINRSARDVTRASIDTPTAELVRNSSSFCVAAALTIH